MLASGASSSVCKTTQSSGYTLLQQRSLASIRSVGRTSSLCKSTSVVERRCRRPLYITSCSPPERCESPSTSLGAEGTEADRQASTSEPAQHVEAELVQDVAKDAEVTRIRWRPASLLSAKHAKPWTRMLGVAGAGVGGILGLGSGFDAQGPSSVASALAVLAAIITIHECGHFVAARLQNIHVNKFAIGFGPPLFKYQGAEVEYSLRAVPLGGFVAFPDDDPDSSIPPDDPDLLKNRPILDRAIVISAGVIANCIFAFTILFMQASTVGMGRMELLPGVKIPKVLHGSVAEMAGMRPGDVVVAVGNQPIPNSAEAVNRLVQYIKDNPEKRVEFKVARKGAGVLDIPMMPELDAEGDGKIGAQLATYAKVSRSKATGPVDAAQRAVSEFGRLYGLVAGGLVQIFTNFAKSSEAISGPIAIVAVGAEVARSDISGLFQFAAIVNINLAVVNTLPLPALDGGYLLLLAIEAARGKKLDKTVEQNFMASGFLLLVSLGVFLVLKDALNLGQSLGL